MASNEAGLNAITDTTELTPSAPLTSLSVPISDMAEHPLARTCLQWEWLNASLESQTRSNYGPNEYRHGGFKRPQDCVEQCQKCLIMLHCYFQVMGQDPNFLQVTWRSIGETSFVRIPLWSISTPGRCITLSAIRGTPNPWRLQGRLPSAESTGSSACMRLVRRWLDDCINNHRSCGSPEDPVLPTRVLDLGQDASTMVSLWEPMGRTGRYVCLSYCWGRSEFTMTTRDNLSKHLKEGIDLQNLPQTFQDAVQIARELKVRYLWIDALCIIQREDDQKDWKRECGNMANIYRNSYLTVAAAWADSANGGCFTTPNPGVAIGPLMVRKVSHIPAIPTLEDAKNLPILTRAWTYQERLLAPRVLYFCHQEILWDCLERRTCECGGATVFQQGVKRLGFHKQTAVDSGKLWREVIEQYTPLQLTCPDDKLPALSGLAQAMGFRQKSYLAGLWEDTLLSDMCWISVSPMERERHQARWRAPSWSWASVDGPISYPFGHLISEDLTRVYEAKCTPTGPSLTGQVEGGSITLEGVLIPVTSDAQRIYANFPELGNVHLDWDPDTIYNTAEQMPAAFLIPLRAWTSEPYWRLQGLVIKPYGQGTEMTRMGLAMYGGVRLGFSGCKKQVVKIV